jgi:hypothetical protein
MLMSTAFMMNVQDREIAARQMQLTITSPHEPKL